MNRFIKGKELSLGYDDPVSTDHMWGPRFYLFLEEKDIWKKEEIMEMFSEKLPAVYGGFPVNFSEPDPQDHGVRHGELPSGDKISPLIYIYTEKGYLEEYLGCTDPEDLHETDWLAFSEHKLLTLSQGTFFRDDLGRPDGCSCKKRLKGTTLEEVPLMGTFSEIANFTVLTENPRYREIIAAFFESVRETG